ncbi:hypothetical protein SEA_KEALII_65 [Arthrobacter phage KeAlii]|uniref:HNH endonuclease n=1 Tax=Arthrobacter phage KeAlii TaxID=2885973 RepID=A0AA94WVU1_9CAUD|nr:endonuclease VII [Arthrobacter phage KeAlii]UDL14671.1 hypothetical protein SEA_KEALII_65 [Arthrobacter phage KeAlii]
MGRFPEVSPAAVQARLNYRRAHSGKTCAKCGEARPLSAFSPDPSKPDGLSSRCKPCEASRRRTRRSAKRNV